MKRPVGVVPAAIVGVVATFLVVFVLYQADLLNWPLLGASLLVGAALVVWLRKAGATREWAIAIGAFAVGVVVVWFLITAYLVYTNI